MLKVFLVEDEIVIREGIKNNIDWEREGFLFVGEAGDGELAYPLIQKTRPDILITDIRMPFMDGLELCRLVRQEMPDVKCMLLSGYDEFEYAKEGINIGITDYLVKPVSGAQLLAAVKKVGKLVEEERQQKEFLETFERERRENVELEKQKFFRRLVSGKKPVSALLKEGRELGMDLAAKRYRIVLFQIFAGGEAEGYSEEQNAAAGAVEEMAGELPEVLTVELGLEGWAFILKEIGEKPLEQILSGFLEKLRSTVEQAGPELEYFGGVGKETERISEFGRCYEEASRAFAYRYLRKRNRIILSGEEPVVSDEELELGSLHVGGLDRRAIEQFLKTGTRGQVEGFLNEYFQSFGKNIQSLLFRQYVIMDVYFTAVAMTEQFGCGSGELAGRCGDFRDISAVFATADQARAYLKKVLETALELRETASQKTYLSLLQEAKAYIEKNYDNEGISLNSVAASVNLSPNHFSTIFSQETGQTFIEFLTSVRMEKAKELLRSTSMKTAEVAFAVGYKDPHYFSYLFKKTQECTPREFRSKA